MIENFESGKKEIFDYLTGARRNPQKRAHEVVTLLESIDKLTKRFGGVVKLLANENDLKKQLDNLEVSKNIKAELNRYNDFCKAYMIYLFKNYIEDDDDIKIMLVAFNYHPMYALITRITSRRDVYARQEYLPKHSNSWDDSKQGRNRGLLTEEARIMNKLSEVLAILAVKCGGYLGLIDDVLATLSIPVVDGNTVNTTSDESLTKEEKRKSADTDKPSVSLFATESLPDIRPVNPDWGDSSPTGTRPIYTLEQINGGILGDIVVFNSISNNVCGMDERFFVGARVDDGSHCGKDNRWHCGSIQVEDQTDYIIRCYIHNNNPRGPFATAKNVKVGFRIPPQAAKYIPVTGFISSSNATPDKYWATVVFKSNTPFKLLYKPGTALLENNGIARRTSEIFAKLSDDILISGSSDGVFIHYNTLDGSIPGCYQYASYVTIRVRAVFENSTTFRVGAKIRLAGSNDWAQSIHAKVGDLAEIQIQYHNLSCITHKNVMIRNILPTNLVYIPGSTKLFNTKYPDGTARQDGVVSDGINIENYEAGTNAYIRFTARVVDATLQSGSNTLVSWSQCCVNGVTRQKPTTVKLQLDK